MGRSSRGIVGTTIFHGIILVIVIFFGFIVPDPPPDEEGILINFGTDETGFGDTEPMYSEILEQAPPSPQEASTPVESTEEIISQDFEDAPVVEAQEEVQQEKVKDTPAEEVVAEAEETPPPPEEEPPKVNERALYTGRANTDKTSGSEGITEGEGNQGSITGSPDSDNYLDGLSSGRGGVDFSLAGRNPVSLPKPEYNVQEASHCPNPNTMSRKPERLSLRSVSTRKALLPMPRPESRAPIPSTKNCLKPPARQP